MKLYIVRHGQSVGNALNIHQTSDTPLSQIGIKQAEFLAQRFTSIKIDKIFSSTFLRALDTAKFIASAIDQEIISTPLLSEIKRPSEILGKSITDPGVRKIKRKVFRLFGTNQHFSDEENYYDLLSRIDDFTEQLDQEMDQSILIVSHGITIKMLVNRLLYKDLLTPRLFHRTIETWRTENTGITILNWEKNHWNLETWNDSAHLGET